MSDIQLSKCVQACYLMSVSFQESTAELVLRAKAAMQRQNTRVHISVESNTSANLSKFRVQSECEQPTNSVGSSMIRGGQRYLHFTSGASLMIRGGQRHLHFTSVALSMERGGQRHLHFTSVASSMIRGGQRHLHFTSVASLMVRGGQRHLHSTSVAFSMVRRPKISA